MKTPRLTQRHATGFGNQGFNPVPLCIPKWGIAVMLLASLSCTSVWGKDKSHDSSSKWSNEASGADLLNRSAFSLSKYDDAQKSWHDDSRMDFSFGGSSESSYKLTSSKSDEDDHKSHASTNDWSSHFE